MAPLGLKFRRGSTDIRRPTSSRKDPFPTLPSLSTILTTESEAPSYLPPLKLDTTPFLSAPPPPVPGSPVLRPEVAKADDKAFGELDEASLWLACSSLPFDQVNNEMEAVVTSSPSFTLRPALAPHNRSPSTNIKRKQVPSLLTIQLGPVTATFEIEDASTNHSVTQSALDAMPDKQKQRKSDSDGDLTSDNGSATDPESSPRSFGVSSQWSSSACSSSASSSAGDEVPPPLHSPTLSEAPYSGLPPFEAIFHSFAPRIYRSLSGISSPHLPSTDLPRPRRATRSLRRKSPPALGEEELAFLERKARRDRLQKPTRIECGTGQSVSISNATTEQSRKGSMESQWSGWYFADSEWNNADGDEEDEEVLIIRNPIKT